MLPRITTIACLLAVTPAAGAQVLVDWDFSALTNPGSPDAPIADPLLPAASAACAPEVSCSPLRGERAQPANVGLRWAATNPAAGELNLRYFDGDLSDPSGTNSDGVSDNYLAFTITPNAFAVQVQRVVVSVWRNGVGAPGVYAVEVVPDGTSPVPFGQVLTDPDAGDFQFDEFVFQGDVTFLNSLEVRFRPVAAPGGQGTGNLHIDGLRVESASTPPPGPTGPNVLFLIADDLTATALGAYGNPDVHTPNLDALAARGVVFDRAYCQFPVCDASRASLLTGWYPDRIQAAGGSWGSFDGALGPHPTLPEHFRLNGWTTARVSKLYHMRVPGDITSGSSGPDHAPSWTTRVNVQAPEWMTPGPANHYTSESLNFDPNAHYNLGFGTAFYTVQATTTGVEQADHIAASEAISLLDGFGAQRFWLGVGLVRPHVPLVAPASTYALYDANQLPLADSVPGDTGDIPPQGIFWNEASRGPYDDAARRSVLEGYYASVTFMDEQVGRVLDHLDQLGLSDSTFIVFTSDHGYHLGEHTMWQKLSLHEESASVPLIIAGPGIAAGRSDSLVELVDLYPTLAELAGLVVPPACQGLSLAPALLGAPAPATREAALSSVSNGDLLRTADWAYMRYSAGGEELYDMRPAPQGDPKQFTNLASSPAHAAVLQELRVRLDARLEAAAASPGQASCSGDGSAGACPCNAYGGAGEGCLTSSGTGAALTGGGVADLSSDSFRLVVSGAPAGQAGLLFHGLQTTSSPLANGILCTTPAQRYGVRFLDGDGGARYEGLAGQATPGTTLHYQFYFRDNAAPCGGGFNFTNLWSVTWR